MTDIVKQIKGNTAQDDRTSAIAGKRGKKTQWFVVSATYTMDCTFSIEAENEEEVRARLESISSESEIFAFEEPDRPVEIYAADLEVTEIEEAADERDGGA